MACVSPTRLAGRAPRPAGLTSVLQDARAGVTKVGEPFVEARGARRKSLSSTGIIVQRHSTAKTHRNWSEDPVRTIWSLWSQAVCPRTAALVPAVVIKQC